jgi:hypothetical protein
MGFFEAGEREIGKIKGKLRAKSLCNGSRLADLSLDGTFVPDRGRKPRYEALRAKMGSRRVRVMSAHAFTRVCDLLSSTFWVRFFQLGFYICFCISKKIGG